jgi:hypothetical protein
MFMREFLASMIVIAVFCSFSASAQSEKGKGQTTHPIPKFENGLLITWQTNSEDSVGNQVEIFDERWHRVASLNVLGPVQEARGVSIYDVSARPGGTIAVAAVYASKEGNSKVPPVAALLLFDFSGQLLRAFSLGSSRAIRLLAIDENSNIWTLTDNAGDKDPFTVPMVIEYRPDGTIARELLTRGMFPLHSTDTIENPKVGSPSLGYDQNGLWFWLPGSTDLVTITQDGASAMTKTDLPLDVGNAVPVRIFREAQGTIIAQLRKAEGGQKPGVGYYRWSAITRSWAAFKPGECDGGILIGLSEKQEIYSVYAANRVGICGFAKP